MAGAHVRPELLASPDWLAENLGRPELRILDVRWRPDGTGRLAFAAGHVPNATYVDWRAAFVDPEDLDTLLLLAPPDQVADAVAGAGISNGSTVVVYDDTASLYAARTWWSLRALIDRAGVTSGRRVVCYDASGIGAAKLAFVLALMGHDDVAVYDGGWADWGGRLDLPVDR